MSAKPLEPSRPDKVPAQRKTTLKWQNDGELSPVDMTRILDRLSKAELTECDLACQLDDSAETTRK